MAKSKYEGQPIVLTVTIPTDGSGKCKMAGNFVDLGIVRAFDYADQNDIATAIQSAAWDLVDMSTNPPPGYDAPKVNGKAEQPAAQQELPAPEAEEAAEEPVEEEAEEAAEEAAEELTYEDEPEAEAFEESLDGE